MTNKLSRNGVDKYMEKELLQKAIDSILHGSTQIVSTVDSYGNTTNNTIRINDLRQDLVSKLAEKLVQTDEFKKALLSIFTNDVVKKIQEQAISTVSYNDLDYITREEVERQMKNLKVEVKSYKLVAETITNQPPQ